MYTVLIIQYCCYNYFSKLTLTCNNNNKLYKLLNFFSFYILMTPGEQKYSVLLFIIRVNATSIYTDNCFTIFTYIIK